MNVLVSAALASALTLGTTASAVVDDVVATDKHGITPLIMRGDANALARIGKSDSIARLAARAGYYRTHGDLAQSNHWADACSIEPAVVAEVSQGTMYLCRSLRAGNKLLQGDIAGWATDMLQVRSIYLEKIAPTLLPGDEVRSITAPAFEKFTRRPASGTLQAPVVTGTAIAVSSKLGVPMVSGVVHADGGKFKYNINADFVIDTGATRSHISRFFAHLMEIEVTEGFALDVTDKNRPVPISLAAPVDFDLGPIHMKDVSFTVTDTMPFNLIGLDLLYQLGPLVLRQESLEMLEELPAAGCDRPLAVTSTLWGSQYSLRLPMRIGKSPQLVLLDTGASLPLEMSGINLMGYPAQALVERRRITMYGIEHVRYAEATAPVMFSGLTATLPVQVTDQPANVFPASMKLGYSLHEDYDYYMDVANGRACLAPRSPASATAA